ncbi:MAG: 2OG-Fe dioxygenase family protein [Sphingobium sp.]
MADAPTSPAPDVAQLRERIARDGFARLTGDQTMALLGTSPDDWTRFAATWNDLGRDLYMADGGRYRRRRHAAFAGDAGSFTRKPHQPHFQSRDYNPLNGDVQRWFDPVEQETAQSAALRAILGLCARIFGPDLTPPWHVEMHQFRIEAKPGQAGQPTPEGMHRDGVDRVFVMLVDRRNVREGVTRIGARNGAALGQFTLARPGDAVMIDDHHILHGVTAIHPLDPALPAWRDALVITFTAAR